ncbi:MAG TPA: hypothetical protein VGX28_13335 [Frankiaceae bacterium]|jgi:hypothetical protein|nr:hypothetical protein [Frankiaceae bacterium]
MTRLLRLGVAAAIVAAAVAPAAAHAWTCSPRGVEPHTYTVAGHSVDAYDVYWVC